MTSFTLLRSKNRKDPKTSEELKAGGTKNIKREMEKKGELKKKKSQTLVLTHTSRRACLRKLKHKQTK